ncbi:MAG: ATP-dependent DNA helicase, partial [Gammaproteobacteria bacterium]|nr:ATP-dependent DNA helicase [Gammaproteobacteria bacterium]
LEEVFGYLNSATVRDKLIQAFLDAPIFPVRWRWNATRSLAVRRWVSGRRLAPHLQRMDAEDLLAVIFPDSLACFENIEGAREVPDHPLVEQTIRDCLEEAMDFDEFVELLDAIQAGAKTLIARDLREPSPLAHEILTARPYAFLDDAPAEERRTLAVQARRRVDPQSADDLGALDAAAIEKVRREAWPS